MLSKSSLQSIKAFVELAKLPSGQCEGAGAIAKRIHAPQNYLGKLLQGFVSRGLVVSQKGLGGGFRLNRPARKISLFDIVEPLEYVSRWSVCFLGKKKCLDSDPCPVHHKWKPIKDQYLLYLKTTTIEDLLNDPKRRLYCKKRIFFSFIIG